MYKFLWDLDIENISCGWENEYQKALIECPEGKYADCITLNGHDFEKVEYNPVSCRNIIITKFNQLKLEANELYSNRNNLDFKMCCNRLFQIDVMLYNLLSTWTYSNDVFCNDEFDPNTILNDIESPSASSYFDNLNPEFDSLKFINFL
ncbi:Uncharacterised protein [Clostridium carnis]|uniref:Uncharacterized protein n=1 Tax=Clostridium carnis TaxID=1530 RepID=A0ABY6SXL4_9CLOT|nr:hypothetical protein [Clostridium carnis]VDG73401.1 Uncharacterised protein [Clostridium carnis]